MKDILYADQPTNQDSDLSERNLTFLASASKTYLTHSQDVTKTGDPYRAVQQKKHQKLPQHRISWISLPSLQVYSVSDSKVQITKFWNRDNRVEDIMQRGRWRKTTLLRRDLAQNRRQGWEEEPCGIYTLPEFHCGHTYDTGGGSILYYNMNVFFM